VDLLSSIEEAHEQMLKFLEKNQINDAVHLLQDCQEGAIRIGTTIDQLEGEGTEAVHILERYCEFTYQIYEELLAKKEVNGRQIRKKLRKLVIDAKNEILYKLSTQYEAVFLPYKASMWDSLESVWMAADEDPDCEAYVIPIPYFNRNPDGSFAQIHYEAESYPDYVPVVGYENFNLEEHHPDMIFIHNPYDSFNYVTSVHPDYYSKKLKDYTDCLVYIPYYTTSGKMSEGQSFCPSYLYADYIVVQSKAIIDQFDPRVPKEKFLPLGSPKFDRVIRLCKNPPDPPAEWKDKIEGKRVYFYNTSISGMLENTENFLKKLKYVFDTFREVEDACLLWRPHPLLRSTFESMRRGYLDEYEALVQYFIEEDIGIYDATPDIEVSIALSDAYIGDSGTSIISLFQAAGKKIYILDNNILEHPPEGWWKGTYFYFPGFDERRDSYIVMPKDKLFWSPNNDYSYEYLCDLTKNLHQKNYSSTFKVDKKVYVFPENSQDILEIDEKRNIRKIPINKKISCEGAFFGTWIIDKYVFLIPHNYPDMIRIDLEDNQVAYIKDVAAFFCRKESDCAFCGGWIDFKNDKLCFLNDDGSKLLSIDVNSLEKESRQFDCGYHIVACFHDKISDTRYIWLIPAEGTKVVRWDSVNDSFREYDLYIDGLKSFDRIRKCESNKFFFGSIMTVSEEEVIFCPNLGNKFVKLNIENGYVEEWNSPIDIYTQDVNIYTFNWGAGYMGRSRDDKNHRWFNFPERIAYDVDYLRQKVTRLNVSFNEDEIYDQYADGFTACEGGLYCLIENGWNPLINIAKEQINGHIYDSDIARDCFLLITENSDGTAGINIFRQLLQKIS